MLEAVRVVANDIYSARERLNEASLVVGREDGFTSDKR